MSPLQPEEISYKEIVYAIVSMLIGAGILTLPRSLAEETKAVDGWISILIAGVIAAFFVWVVAKLATKFPQTTFVDYAAKIVTKPIAVALTFLFACHFIGYAAYETRVVGDITVLYLFDRTPNEVVALLFLLIVIYAVYGSTFVILRLNLMFLPIILFISLLIPVLNVGFIELDNAKPIYTSSAIDYLQGIKVSAFSLLGFEILLFYIAFLKTTKKVVKGSMMGIGLTVVIYLVIYLTVVGVFGNETTKNLWNPTIELAKEVQIPGEFFERFESIFFTIWIMTLFNTTAMAFDVAVIALKSILPKIKRTILISVLSPIIYMIAFFPRNMVQVEKMGEWMSYSGLFMSMTVPLLILIIAKIRRIQGNE
ncbi:GerAB/ArcD/ProY family transporter [Bacillus suaedae]|uniref:Endospore germination permease n=1 Tax=Halalkalibacter suaedae TaxID=2822140 RepID=A0A940WUI5_9BACI|nr:endospore germination permease [Bacillus suaedae]MBP3950493.1 endospore germination permease [Bacillus suaedae]